MSARSTPHLLPALLVFCSTWSILAPAGRALYLERAEAEEGEDRLLDPSRGWSARLEDDVLVVGRGWRVHSRIGLGSLQSLYDPPRPNATFMRRSGRSGETVGAVLVKHGQLHHVFILWPEGHLEMIWKGDHWLTHDLDLDESALVRRRLFATPKFEWGGSKFQGCWPGQESGLRSMKIGFAFDKSFLDHLEGDKAQKAEQAEELVSQITNAANTVYENQLGIHIFVSHQLTEPEDFDDPDIKIGTTCAQTINYKLEDWKFIGETKLKEKYPNAAAAWMFITRCYPPPGTVGLAYVGTICSPANGYAVTTDFGSTSKNTWLTFTHELGHVLGAGHSFENGQGSTGGIMDYGDGKYQGQYQFHPNRKKDICTTLDRTMNKPRWSDLKSCWTSYDPEKDKDRVGIWYTSEEFGACDLDCLPDESVIAKTRKQVSCRKTKAGAILEDSKCMGEKPADQEKPCETQPQICGDAPRWVKSDKTAECKSDYTLGMADGEPPRLPCGAGKQYEYTCRSPEGDELPRDQCTNKAKAELTRDCRILKKDEEGKIVVDKEGNDVPATCDDTYMWVESPDETEPTPTCTWTEAAYEIRKIICLDTASMEPAKASFCIGPKPKATFKAISSLPKCTSIKESNDCCSTPDCVEHSVQGLCERESTAVDAAVCAPEAGGRGYMYIFLGSHVRVMQGCDLAHREKRLGYLLSYFHGLPDTWDRIDAAIVGPGTYSKPLLLFKKDEVAMYSLEEGKLLEGFPKPLKDFFPGLIETEACTMCATRVVTGFFEEDSQTFRLFCGDSSMYCVGQRPWQADKQDEVTTWSARPTQDFGLPQIRAFTSLSGDSWGLLGMDGSSCTIPGSANLPTPCNKADAWWKNSQFSAEGELMNPCQKLSFCAKCSPDQKTCEVCDPGFSKFGGHCVHYQSRLHIGAAPQFDEESSDKVDESTNVAGPFKGVQAISLDNGKTIKMKSILDDGDVVVLRKFGLSFWVKGTVAKDGGSWPLLVAKQSPTATLRITWSHCGPGMNFVNTENKTKNWAVSCTAFATKPIPDGWNFVSFDFTASLTVTLNTEQAVVEAEISPITLEDWSLGGAAIKEEKQSGKKNEGEGDAAANANGDADANSEPGTENAGEGSEGSSEQSTEEGGGEGGKGGEEGDAAGGGGAQTENPTSPDNAAAPQRALEGAEGLKIGTLHILDHEIWPKVTFQALDNGSKALFVLAALLFVLCCVGIYFVFHISEVLPSQVWWHILVEGYILVMNFIFAFFGIFMMVATWATLATQEIGVTDLFSDGLIAGDLKFLMWPFWIGLFCYLGGLVGIRTARTRKGCLVCIYLVSLIFNICLCCGLWVKISATELHLSGRSDLLGTAASTGNEFYAKGQAPFMKSYYETYESLIKGDQYNCKLAEGQTGDCGAELNGAPLMECQRPHPAARAFQDLVNKYCTKDIDISGCGHCLETWGQRSKLDDWDPLKDTNKVFCRCTTAVIDKGVSWVKSTNWAVKLVVINAVMLLLAEVILACFVPSKRELLAKQADELYAKTKARLADMRRRRDGNAELREAHRNMEPRHTEVELGSSLHGFSVSAAPGHGPGQHGHVPTATATARATLPGHHTVPPHGRH